MVWEGADGANSRQPLPDCAGSATEASETGHLWLMPRRLALLVALATWSVKDPSLSHAVDLRPKNWLGYPGAIASDFLMQLFGIASAHR